MPKTSTGRKLVARGFEGSKADWIAHVCFDSYFGEPSIFFYKPEVAALVAKTKEGVSGSRVGASEKGTGFGAKVLPVELGARRVAFKPDERFSNEPLGDRGVAEVRGIYESFGWTIRDATKQEQVQDKIDLVATKGTESKKIEVKARGEDKAFRHLFIQTHEANPDKRIS